MSDDLQDWEKCECGQKATKRFFELNDEFELTLYPVCSKCYSGKNNQLIRSPKTGGEKHATRTS